ncbi:HAD family hydrolase [Roseovarius sp. B08]|uniref:HAD family hydrolase n=1 Tax=Roseovarius sp. B08 TaxID=3449223 RepID=UPI003EDC4286
MAKKPVIGIDLDGTVLDCRPRQQAVTLKLLPEAEPYADALWTLKREGYATRIALEKLDIAVPESFDHHWINLIEHPRYLALDHLLPSVETALNTLSKFAELHLITARQDSEGVHSTLSRLKISDFFANVKVVPAGSGAVIEKAGYLSVAGAVAHCGDTEVDGRSAANAGVRFWAVTSGQRSESFLLTHTTPDRIAHSLQGIANKYSEMN